MILVDGFNYQSNIVFTGGTIEFNGRLYLAFFESAFYRWCIFNCMIRNTQ